MLVQLIALLSFVSSALSTSSGEADRCTAIAVGPAAGVDGTMTTHAMDCFNCDFRINKVPSQYHEKGSKRPLHIYKADYPAQVDSTRGETWQPYNLEGTSEQKEKWQEHQVITGYIPQVKSYQSS